MDPSVLERFSNYEELLRTEYPQSVERAKELAEAVVDPRRAGPDDCWRVLWNKPLYANQREENGTRTEKEIAPSMRGAWVYIGVKKDDFNIEHCRELGIVNDAFTFSGDRVFQIRERSNVAMYRLYAIQGAAAALRERVVAFSAYPFSDLYGQPLRCIVKKLRNEMGLYWGHITILHALTDFGLACKPDRHVVRTARALGFDLKWSDRSVPSVPDSLRINEAVCDLTKQRYGRLEPVHLRYIDKIMMEISRVGLLNDLEEPMCQSACGKRSRIRRC